MRLISEDNQITTQELAMQTGMTNKGVEYQLKRLKDEGAIRRIGPDKGGYLEINKGE